MAKHPPIRVFEHQRLSWKDSDLKPKHIQRLIVWNEANGNQYFTVGYKKFIFTQYVGVIQVGDRVIEVLPKADRREADSEQVKDKWHAALLTMLRAVHELPLTSTTETALKKRSGSILDFFFGMFVSDVEDLVHHGLVKRYRRTKGNQTALKGRIDFPRHIQKNLIHQERFYVEHQVYDTDHLLHSLLKEALSIVQGTAIDDTIASRSKGLHWAFEDVADRQLTPRQLEHIVLDRKTAPYARAIQLAMLIVLNHAPDLKGGNMPLIGLMFDMNMLFERFVYKELSKASRHPEHVEKGLVVRNQRRKFFWRKKTIRPDIVLEYEVEGISKRVIVDTKWKVPTNGKPNDTDLKQMFVYNIQFIAEKSVLLYPFIEGCKNENDQYADSEKLGEWGHHCHMEYAEMFNEIGAVKGKASVDLLSRLM